MKIFITLIILVLLNALSVFSQKDVCKYDVTEKEIEADIVANQIYTFTVTSTANVVAGSMIVEFDTWHPKKEQFKAVICHPDGSTCVTIADLTQAYDLGNASGSAYGSPNAKYVIFDGVGSNMDNAADALPGNYQPQTGTFSIFDGMATNGNWTITFTDKDGSFDNRGYVRNVFLKFDLESGCTPPATPPTGLSFSNVASYSTDLSWTNNSGDNVIVIARLTADIAIIPESETSYTANFEFGLGDELRTATFDNVCDYSGNFVVYKGTGTNVSVTGLTSGTSYTYDIYTATGTCFNETALTDVQATPCPSGLDPARPLPTAFRTCGSASGTEVSDAGTLTYNIEVYGLSGSLATATNNLRQVRVALKNGTDEDLSLYTCIIKAPDGSTSSTIFSTGRFATSMSSIDITFRESSRLNVPSSSSAMVYNVGYYRINTAGDFTSTFNGYATPNGTWTVVFTETAGSTVDDVQLDFVELEFGSTYTETDISTLGANCSNAEELTLGIYLSSNSNSDTDDGNQPTKHTTCGDGISGCGCWNASYNEAQYLKYTATSETFKMAISGIQASTGDLQVLVVEGNPAPCSGHGNWTVVTCPETTFDNTPNTFDGASHAGKGTIENIDLSMDNALIGNTYYIVIDGDAGATANYYIDVKEGIASTLPIKLLSFNAYFKNTAVNLSWQTASEINNDFFTIERSIDGKSFENIGFVNGAGNSYKLLTYSFIDNNPYLGTSYYRLKQTDFDGKFSYSEKVAVSALKNNFDDVDIYYSKTLESYKLKFITENDGLYNLTIYDITGNALLNKSGKFNKGFNNINIPEKNNKTRLVFAKIIINNEIYYKKLIVN